jgi:hypothetical protein
LGIKFYDTSLHTFKDAEDCSTVVKYAVLRWAKNAQISWVGVEKDSAKDTPPSHYWAEGEGSLIENGYF